MSGAGIDFIVIDYRSAAVKDDMALAKKFAIVTGVSELMVFYI
jgi:hypothetical protein